MPDNLFVVHVEGSERHWECQDGESIAQGADRAQQGHLLSGCRGGGCGVCKVQVISGRVHMRVHGCNTLTQAERSQGIVLACSAEPRTNLVIRLLERPSFLSNLSSPRR